ncbi:hypothetical protein QK290_15950 [Pseudarthrobacter sp. AL07]|uniref:hypothetical protein n=1 Tax=unclassified Pseudarthrobacter TaxID=2647000 RepID=UPI00249CDF27|nr:MULTISPECIES: hypothetical protein [unclassified Pseudarthrobacter]MDI3195884.1 hypothetical protein [Pseudarthrobacter sp. AL20]MDI3209956.1 hypothetical protein [Pseudarthrobacter sp. AL07]
MPGSRTKDSSRASTSKALFYRAPACLRAAQEDKAIVELIADGAHLDPAIVTAVFQLVGAANIVLVSDSMAAAGLTDGNYMLGPSPVTVTGGVATLDATGSAPMQLWWTGTSH